MESQEVALLNQTLATSKQTNLDASGCMKQDSTQRRTFVLTVRLAQPGPPLASTSHRLANPFTTMIYFTVPPAFTLNAY